MPEFIIGSRVGKRRASLAVLILCLTMDVSRGSAQSASAIVTGVVRNKVTHEPMRVVVVRASTTNASTITDDAGRFRLELPMGEQRLDVRRIGYKPASASVTVAAGGATVDIQLDPVAVTLDRVLITAQDDFARRLVAAAIARKQQLRGSVHDYRYHGDVRLIVTDAAKSADSAVSVRVITETQTEAYWEQPNQYQETIVARRQTGNIEAENNLVGVGQILNISRERVLFARFELPSPIADDALDLYDYRVLDTLTVSGRRTYRLSVEPKPNGAPAFVGMMDVVDSTFDVVGIDVGVNKEVRASRARDIRYRQHFREIEGGRWMPSLVELTATFDFAPFGTFSVHHTAALSNFRFNEAQRPTGLGEYRIKVAPNADRPDSVRWTRLPVPPLTAAESLGWKRIDSIVNRPRAPAIRALNTVARFGLTGGPDFFHFNRVDGVYIGAGHTWFDPSFMPRTSPTLKLGYAAGSKLWQYRVGDRVLISDDWRMWIGATYHDETVNRPTLTAAGYAPTLRALFARIDPLDYYRDRGLTLSFTSKLAKLTDVEFGFMDSRQTSLALVAHHPPLRLGRDTLGFRANLPIDDGHLRAVSGGVAIDSRPRLKQGIQDVQMGRLYYTRLAVGGEWSPGGAVGSDFDYRRATLQFIRRQESYGMGVTTLIANAGYGSASLPIQRSFNVDGKGLVLERDGSPFSTLSQSIFTGSRAAVVSFQHDFDRLLFTKTRLPLVRDIPFTLSVRAAAFWAEYPTSRVTLQYAARRVLFNTTRDPYREVGVTVGNLTPFLPLINLSARFGWQVSRYPTTPFRFSIGLSR